MSHKDYNREQIFKLTISDWEDGIWGNRTHFFQTLHDAKQAAKQKKGSSKIYNQKGHLIHSDNRKNDNSYA